MDAYVVWYDIRTLFTNRPNLIVLLGCSIARDSINEVASDVGLS